MESSFILTVRLVSTCGLVRFSKFTIGVNIADAPYRPRHSPFCQAMDLTKVPKDVLGRLLRSITSEPFMFEPIKNYVRTILRLDSMPDAGRVNRIIFTCALVQDPVHDKRGKPSRYYMLQFSKVDRYPCSPPPVEDDETEEELRRSGVDITLVFRMDIRGAEVAQSMPTTVEKTPRMDTVDECRADPVAHLLYAMFPFIPNQ